jgi:hypothetical protein
VGPGEAAVAVRSCVQLLLMRADFGGPRTGHPVLAALHRRVDQHIRVVLCTAYSIWKVRLQAAGRVIGSQKTPQHMQAVWKWLHLTAGNSIASACKC